MISRTEKKQATPSHMAAIQSHLRSGDPPSIKSLANLSNLSGSFLSESLIELGSVIFSPETFPQPTFRTRRESLWLSDKTHVGPAILLRRESRSSFASPETGLLRPDISIVTGCCPEATARIVTSKKWIRNCLRINIWIARCNRKSPIPRFKARASTFSVYSIFLRLLTL